MANKEALQAIGESLQDFLWAGDGFAINLWPCNVKTHIQIHTRYHTNIAKQTSVGHTCELPSVR